VIWLRWRHRVESWRPGFGVRRDWPDGTHEYFAFNVRIGRAARAAAVDRAYWRLSHLRPRCSVVVISRRDFALHGRRRLCRAPDCPVAVDRVAAVLGPVWQ